MQNRRPEVQKLFNTDMAPVFHNLYGRPPPPSHLTEEILEHNVRKFLTLCSAGVGGEGKCRLPVTKANKVCGKNLSEKHMLK